MGASAVPNPNTERQRTKIVGRELPAEGRTGPAPEWPSGHDPSDAEAAAWARLWRLPQAVAWELAPGSAEIVERYARVSVAVSSALSSGEVSASVLAQMRGMEADLGLSPAGMARLHWHVMAEAPEPAKVTPLTSVKRPRRMRATGGD